MKKSISLRVPNTMGYNLYELLLPLKKYKGYWHIHNDQAWFYENQELVDLFQDGECMKTGEFFLE